MLILSDPTVWLSVRQLCVRLWFLHCFSDEKEDKQDFLWSDTTRRQCLARYDICMTAKTGLVPLPFCTVSEPKKLTAKSSLASLTSALSIDVEVEMCCSVIYGSLPQNDIIYQRVKTWPEISLSSAQDGGRVTNVNRVRMDSLFIVSASRSTFRVQQMGNS